MPGKQTSPARPKASTKAGTKAGTKTGEEPLFLTVEAAAHKLGLSRALVYPLVMRGDLQTVKVGRRRVVPAWAVKAYARKVCEDAHLRDDYGLMTA